MRKILFAVLCLTIPGLLLLNAWQGYRYNDLSDRVADLERQQKALLEKNRDAIAQIAWETSPARVEGKATSVSGLAPLDPSAVTRLQVGNAASAGGSQ